MRWFQRFVGAVWFTYSGIKEITGGRAGGDESEVLFGSQEDGGSSTSEGQRSH